MANPNENGGGEDALGIVTIAGGAGVDFGSILFGVDVIVGVVGAKANEKPPILSVFAASTGAGVDATDDVTVAVDVIGDNCNGEVDATTGTGTELIGTATSDGFDMAIGIGSAGAATALSKFNERET